MTPTFEFTIDRSRWACASNNQRRGARSRLLTKDGFRCCLGFLASACGAPDETLHMMVPFSEQIPAGMTNDNDHTLGHQAIAINDDEPDNTKRERQLRELFAQAGIRVHFVGKYLQ